MDGLKYIGTENDLRKFLKKNHRLHSDLNARVAFPNRYFRSKNGDFYRKGSKMGKFFDPGLYKDLEKIEEKENRRTIQDLNYYYDQTFLKNR